MHKLCKKKSSAAGQGRLSEMTIVGSLCGYVDSLTIKSTAWSHCIKDVLTSWWYWLVYCPLQHSWISQPLEDNAILATEVIDW